MPTLHEMEQLLDQVSNRLRDEPDSRHTVLEMATVLTLLAHWLEDAVPAWADEPGRTADDRATARALLLLIDDGLTWVRNRRDVAPVADLLGHVQLALTAARRLIDMLRGESS